jgi:hypothetical protein
LHFLFVKRCFLQSRLLPDELPKNTFRYSKKHWILAQSSSTWRFEFLRTCRPRNRRRRVQSPKFGTC